MAPHRKFSDDVRLYAVQSLACFDTPTAVAKAIKAEYGVEISPQAVELNDPTKKAGCDLGKKWVAIFHETRKAFLEDTANIGVSHRAVRLRALQRMVDKAEGMGAIGLAAQLLEQAAKECGDAYTNRLKLAGDKKEPLFDLSGIGDTLAQKLAKFAGSG